MIAACRVAVVVVLVSALELPVGRPGLAGADELGFPADRSAESASRSEDAAAGAPLSPAEGPAPRTSWARRPPDNSTHRAQPSPTPPTAAKREPGPPSADDPAGGATPDPRPPPAGSVGQQPDAGSAEQPPDAGSPGSARALLNPPIGAGAPAPGARYAWPLHPAPTVLSPFRSPDHAYGPGHRGVDLAGIAGQAVVAARAGVVVFAGPVGGRGVVSVEHDDGLRTTYEPLRPTVRAGTPVAAGVVLGLLDPGHRGCQRVCLHWGVRRDRLEYLDPLVLLQPPRVRLLPVATR